MSSPSTPQLTTHQHRIRDAFTRQADTMAALQPIMSALAKAGVHAGVNLRTKSEEIRFDHRTLLLIAVKPECL